jgi:hypothetical protein
MALSGLVLAKIGVPLSAEALRALFDTLRAGRREALFTLPDQALHLATQSSPPERSDQGLAAFSVALANLLHELPELSQRPARGAGERETAASGTGAGGSDSPSPDLARIILNVQAGGAVAHRIGTLPIYVDGRLLELDIALFEEGDQAARDDTPATRHRGISLAITLPLLGRVELRARIAGSHIRLALITEASDSAQFLAQHAARLATGLEQLGWQVDELAYQVRTEPAASDVVQTVVEHLISPGSVSALA